MKNEEYTINNEVSVCIKGKRKLMLISKNMKKEMSFNDEISENNMPPINSIANYIIDPNGNIYENIS